MTQPLAVATWLVGDIGGTSARFGLMEAGGPAPALLHSRVIAAADHAGIGAAIDAFLAGCGGLPRPLQGVIAVAAPLAGDRVRMTNHPWQFSISELRRRLGFTRLDIINDFTAQALALPLLTAADRIKIGGGEPVAGRPLAILGPGSGLGVSGLVPAGDPAAPRWIPLSGEGGHATLAPASARESAVAERLRRQFGHVSAERCLSGPGLVNLYHALAAIDGVPATVSTAAQVTDPEAAAGDPRCREATEMFCAMLGTVAGNLALVLGAQGGVYIGGGIVPRLGARFAASPFRERFEAKGRFRRYLAAIPTLVVTHELPAFLGCAAVLAG